MRDKKAAVKAAPYKWVTSIPLPTLRASGSGDELLFSTGKEEAVVAIDASGITKVVHRDLVAKKESTIELAAAHKIVVGENNWTRDVFHFLKPNPVPHLQLRLGFTVHRGQGTWSSLPHDFETRPEPGFEEAFFYLTSGGPKKGYQVGRGKWPDGSDVDGIWPFTDRTFGAVPMGHHPVVGEPHVQVRYIWAYLCKKKSWEKI